MDEKPKEEGLEAEREPKKGKMGKWLLMTVIVMPILAIVIVGIGFIPVEKTIAYPCYETEYYDCEKTREYPCYETEYYTETEPYIDYVNVDYEVTDTGIYDWFWHIGSDVWVTIKNADTKSGYFYVTFNMETEGGATTTKYKTEYIVIGDEEQILVKHSGDYIKTFTYSIDPPQKEVTRYREVEKTRQVLTTCTETYWDTCEREVPSTCYREETRALWWPITY